MQINTITDEIEVIELEKSVSETLNALEISETYPGTILRDFEAFLDIIKKYQIFVSASNKSILLSQLREINEKLPLRWNVSLKRPVQKSFPNIHSLFLLARCSGLTEIKNMNRKHVLSIREELYEKWQKLSSEEKYLNLLRVWLLNAHPEVIGEKGDNFRIIRNILWFILDILTDTEADYKTRNDELSTVPELYNLMLCQMFGFIDVKYEETEGQTIIEKVKRTPVGKAFMSLVLRVTLSDRWYAYAYEAKPEEVFNRWKKYFNPYFPNWKTNLIAQTKKFRAGLYIFKVQINKAWRRIGLSAEEKLDDLCLAILSAFDFDNDHLYTLEIKNNFGITVSYSHPYTEDIPATTDYRIGDVDLKPGDVFEFIYDFGDNWEFKITFEGIQKLPKNYRNYTILRKAGKAPDQYGDLFM